jgi:septum site-determining protein MinD
MRVIGIASGKGGVGKTTVSTNLAIALKNLGKKVLLVDCNLSTPHLAYYLGVSDYKYTLNDAMRGKVDIISAVNVKDGIKYIPASLELQDLHGVDPTTFKKHLKKLENQKFDFVILDSAPGLGREALSVLHAADEIIFVATPFAAVVNDVIRSSELLKGLKGAKNIGLVMNMVTDGTHEIGDDSITSVTGIPVIGKISYDQNVVFGLVMKSPVLTYKPRSSASENFMQLASYLAGEEYVPSSNMKLRAVLKKIRNYLLPQKVIMSQSPDDLKSEVFMQKPK